MPLLETLLTVVSGGLCLFLIGLIWWFVWGRVTRFAPTQCSLEPDPMWRVETTYYSPVIRTPRWAYRRRFG
jgi:hypothetical protein